MPTPVKTLLLGQLKDALAAIDGIDSAVRNPSYPVTRETIKGTVAHLWDERTIVTRRNRIDIHEMPVQVDVWFQNTHENDASDAADLVEAEIIKHILNPQKGSGIMTYAMKIDYDPAGFSDKDLVDEFLSALVVRFTATFSTVAGDPYTLAKTITNGGS